MQVLTNQEFTYRESPAEQDGYGKFKTLYGNTLVWNQLIQNGNFADTSWWSFTTGTLTVSNNIGTFKATAQWQSVNKGWFSNAIPQGRKLLCIATVKSYTANNTYFMVRDAENGVSSNVDQITLSTTKQTYYIIHTRSSGTSGVQLLFQDNNSSRWGNIEISNVMLFDLTQMGLDSLTVEQFTSLFPKPYYDYCQGAMLSFGGRNVKFNQLVPIGKTSKSTTVAGVTITDNRDGSYTFNGTATATSYLWLYNRQTIPSFVKPNHKYLMRSLSSDVIKIRMQFILYGSTAFGRDETAGLIVTTPSDFSSYTDFGLVVQFVNGNTFTNEKLYPVLIDLTDMFGAGNEPSAEGFKQLFPNDYYEYNAGQYMNLGQPVSLKTVGKNLLPTDLRMANIFGLNNDKSIYQFNTSSAPYTWSYANSAFRVTLPSGNYKVGFIAKQKSTSISTGLILTDSDNNFIVSRGGSLNNLERGEYSFSLTKTTDLGLCVKVYDGIWWVYIIDAESEMATYEPYTESTLSIPLDEFPNGMDGINDVRDEKNETGYKKVIGEVDLGTLNYGLSSESLFNTDSLVGISKPASFLAEIVNAICPLYRATYGSLVYQKATEAQYCMGADGNGRFYFYDPSKSSMTAERFKVAMNGVKLKFELKTSLENYGIVDLGTLSYTLTSESLFTTNSLQGIIKSASWSTGTVNAVCPLYRANIGDRVYRKLAEAQYCLGTDSRGVIYIYDPSKSSMNAEQFKASVSGVYLLYEKETPTETVYPPQSKEEYPFFKSYKGGTEQLLPENGSVPVTAPILADMNYSNGAIEVTTYPNPEQGGETSGDGWYLVGEEATVNALPNEHYAFNNWVLDGEIVSTDPEYTFEVQDE